MEYITVRQFAEKWDISERLVQKYCARGRIPGARKFGTSWEIPADAGKPEDPRRYRYVPKTPSPGKPLPEPRPRPENAPELPETPGPERQPLPEEEPRPGEESGLMPLMNTPFPPGKCVEYIRAMEDGPRKEIAWAEYHYFSGQAERAAQEAELYLVDRDLGIRLSACLIYAYANLSIGEIQRAGYTLSELNRNLAGPGTEASPRILAAKSFAASAAAVLLHLPLPQNVPPADAFLTQLPPGLRAFALYVRAHYLYLQGDYATSLGMVEATLTMQIEVYPIPAIYLHLVAVMDNMSLRRPEAAQAHLLAAWDLARPDDLIEGFGEHHGLLGGMLEAVIKKEWPEDFKRIIEITYRFSAGWRRIHNPATGHDVADNLTTTEFAVAMLAARGWTNQEIAAHMNISPHTVKRYVSQALEKLKISQRQDLVKFMLQ